MRLLKILVVLVVLAFVALAGYAYLGDMGPRQQEMRKPVSLDTGTPAAAVPANATTTDPAPEATPAEPDAQPGEDAPEQSDDQMGTNELD
ncbi:hypothetical protein [Paracoccus xiamenensis]|uniref:hypothetical protein n=1 Tax=Paracoccus xiamenensis TaxID=2714901 RepID=UPI00140B1919|nr:hypothetical protein [Paracoccus xiamenensis]NHF72233.1 hypothetical protein [Paracoccus xiamenensis]